MKQVKRFWRNNRTAAAGQGGRQITRLLLPLLTTLAAAGLLLVLGFTRLEMVGHITQDGFAVPQTELVELLRNGETGLVTLTSVSMGDNIYTRGGSQKNYVVGDGKKAIDAGYPLFAQSGQVLCFLSDSMNLVTWNWEVLKTYDGLYLSDGVTFNRDRSQADLQRVLLVQVDGGYQVARSTTVKNGSLERAIPMNSVCVFEENSILYFDYQNGNLLGRRISADRETVITIGEDSFNYLSFLRNLGLWAEKAAAPVPQKTAASQTPAPAKTEPPETPSQSPQSAEREHVRVTSEPKENDGVIPTPKPPEPPQPPSTVLQEPGAAIESPDKNPPPPFSAPPPVDINPGYVVPTVVINPEIEAAVYTLNINALISDPSYAIFGGVQIYVYEVTGNRETQALRQVLNASGKVYLGQFKPDTQYRLKAKYSYKDKQGYPQTKEWEIGTQRTLPFSELRSIAVSFYDEFHVPAGGAAVDIFPTELQLRSLVFSEVSNGVTVETGGVSGHISADLSKPETYINVMNLKITGQDGSVHTVKVNAGVLRLLREGYTLSHFESGGMLPSGESYTYTLELIDRYNNVFSLEGTTNGGGHTCKNSPRVNIRVPGKTNVAGSVQLDVTWSNPDAAPVSANGAESSVMGAERIAGLFLVRQGDEVIPQNAIPLDAYPLNNRSAALQGEKFLPVTVNTDGSVTTVTTGWVITNLEVLKGYSAGVLCGEYDVDDGREHIDAVLDATVNFVTASLKNLGVVSYTSEVRNITSDTAELSFRMNSADSRLLPLLDAVTLSLTADGEKGKSVTLLRDELKAVAAHPTLDETDGMWRESVNIPVHLEGVETETEAELILSGPGILELSEGVPAGNVWDYLLATSATETHDRYRLTLKLGGELRVAEGNSPVKLFNLSPKTSYSLRYKTGANQGGEEYDVSSTSARAVTFTTKGLDAKVKLGSVFASADFAELYGLSVNDPDGCVRPDDADRDGCNAIIRITNESGALVGSKYIDTSKTYDGLRISGLQTGTKYLMTVYALKYSADENMEVNFALDYAEPQDTASPKVYTFITGQSVIGDLSMEGVNQLYGSEDGGSTDALSILSPEDIYMGVWQYGATLHYSSDEAKESYLEQVRGIEAGSDEEETEALLAFAAGETGSLIMSKNDSVYVSNGWTTRFIAVRPGEKYCIYNTEASGYLRINLYYKDAAGNLKSYSMWASNDNYMRGGVFRIPDRALTGNANADRICYMRIAGYTQRDCDGMILVKFDDTQTALQKNLADGMHYVEGMSLDTSNGQGFSAGYAYTEDYIPVTSGSVYELTGRDPNRTEEDALNNRGSSYSAVLFYDKSYGFLGGYNVCSQTSLVKAPFGAAYCRFNVMMHQVSNTAVLNISNVSMRLYKGAVADRYLVKLKARLTDDSESQILTGGSYTVKLYSTLSGTSDSDDLAAADYVQLGEPQVFPVTADDLEEGKLNVTKQLRFENLNPGMGFKATLTVTPEGWKGEGVVVDTVYFTTNRVVHTVSDLAGLKAIRNDPAGSYVVTADITGVTGNIISSDRPFTGTIDFQGHSVTTSGFGSLFYRISSSGVVKNLIYNYNARAQEADTYQSGMGTVATINYGTMQNIIVHYAPDNQGYGIDVRYAGGIVRYNYGTIDGFMVQFMKDVRAYDSFGGICQDNYGHISNGYICADRVRDGGTERSARLIHIWKNSSGAVLSSQTPNLSYGVGNNTTRGIVENVFAVGDLVIQSDDARTDYSNADYQTGNEYYETSTTGTNTAAILIGSNAGAARNAFTVGDRLDYDPDENRWSYMLDRGPAIANVTGRYEADNISCFTFSSNAYSQKSSSASAIGTFNRKGEFESLFDYQWYEAELGHDGERFTIRENVELGFYPQLNLPDCFPKNAQPELKLPASMLSRVEVIASATRQQGVNSALVTITLNFPYAGNATVTGFTVTDRQNRQLNCTVLAQRSVGDSYRVDALLSLSEGALADSSYTITGVQWTGGSRNFTGVSSEREVKADFWQEISDAAQWKAAMVSPTAYIFGNYLLTADIDFSGSVSYSDWFCSQRFCGTLNGGVYSTKTVTLTDDAGSVILDRGGQPMTMEVWDGLTGMHTISGVGNVDADGVWQKGRDGSSRSSLISALYGTVENLIFRDFVSTDKGTLKNSVNSYYGGVICYSREGARLENCHVRDSVFFARGAVAALVGDASGTSMRLCSVKDTKICCFKTDTGTDSVSTGALFGSMTNGIVESCFAANVTVEALNVFATTGVGGLGGNANGAVVQDCYTTGTVNAAGSYVGGVLGRMTGAGTLTGCWSTASVQTVSDYAGGIVGYHADGILTGNYTASTVVTRSLASSSVHRICSNPAYNEEKRFANYAFKGQFMTYTDPSLTTMSIYQFGTWDKLDGSTALLDTNELENAGVWKNVISVGESYDLTGGAASGSVSGGTRVTGVQDGFMPKLTDSDTGLLLYDQPDVMIGKTSDTILTHINVGLPVTTNEEFIVYLVLYSDAFDPNKEGLAFEDIADWEHATAVGAVVDATNTPLDDSTESVYGFHDFGEYIDASRAVGRRFGFRLKYGAAAGRDGHYLDSYIFTLPVNIPGGGTEMVQVRISLSEPVYKILYNINDWDNFFSDSRYAQSYENVLIDSKNEDDAGVIDFSSSTSYSDAHGGAHVINVKANRLSGKRKGGQFPTVKNANLTFSAANQNLISQIVTMVSDINFENISLVTGKNSSGNYYGGDNKGVIAQLQGDAKNVSFTNINIDGGGSSYAGCVGTLWGKAEDIRMKNISIKSYGNYVGGFAGFTNTTSTISNVSLSADAGERNTVMSKNNGIVGGIAGAMYGLGSDLTVEDADIQGRAYVGGAVGYAYSDAGRPTERKLVNVTVGSPGDASASAGSSAAPGVMVTLAVAEGTNSSEQRYGGGAVGHGNSRSMKNLKVYGAQVSLPARTETVDTTDDGTYSYYLGGVVGVGGSGLTESLAKNVTVASYGGWCGGVSGDGTGQQNRAEDCVIYGISPKARNVGGISGIGATNRCVAKHCVVIGATDVGGVLGKQTGWCRENGAVDCVVLGETSVGGISGQTTYYHTYDDYVTATTDKDGNATVRTTVDVNMLRIGSTSGLLGKFGASYIGTVVKGTERVGGLVGELAGGIYIRDSYVAPGVKVSGNTDVGGIVGRFYGWYADSGWPTTNTYFYTSACGAEVKGTENVGGIIGCYTRSKTGNPSSALTSIDHPNTNFYGYLFTGSVTGSRNAHFLVGSYTENTADNGVDSYLKYCRVYENSTLNGTKAGTLYAGASYDTVQAITVAAERTGYAGVLTVTAENLSDPNVYFQSRDTAYGGMGWSRTVWSAEAMDDLYVKTENPASTATYQAGINKNGQVLWLDARNNTGHGYTDESGTVWKDLSGSHNDATLYWAYKDGDKPLSVEEKTGYMAWANGGLEFYSSNNSYYAKLMNSLSPYLQENYTVELIYTYLSPAHSGHGSLLSWWDGGYNGGFLCTHNVNSGANPYSSTALYYDVNSTGGRLSSWVGGSEMSTPLTRTASFVVGADSGGSSPVTYYINGAKKGAASRAAAFRDNMDVEWRIGGGMYSSLGMRVCGVRVYSRALTETEIQENAAYDKWYYFGGDKPDHALDTVGGITLRADGTASQSGLMLMRSDGGSYNGTLVCESFTSGTPLGSRGYYYLTDGSGNYSNIVAVTAPGYGPLLRTANLYSEYYSAIDYNVPGQEGVDGGGTLFDCGDGLINGGFWLPESALMARSPLRRGLMSIRRAETALPELTAYASGVDRVNLEIKGDVPAGLQYEILSGSETKLSGSWPADSRTLTMTWDYSTAFTLRISLGEQKKEYNWTGKTLSHSVMTYGDGYWYRHYGECLDKDGNSAAPEATVIHMMYGSLLDDAGNIRSVEDGRITGRAVPFTIASAQPLWSGKVGENSVSSFGTYLLCDGGVRNTQLVVRGDCAYTMPARDVIPGSFVVDSYNSNLYTTILTTGGSMVDLGSALSYPKDFSAQKIAELSCSVGYSGHMVLVRYESGKLAAFNYLTGEEDEVSSEVEEVSLFEFILSGLAGNGDKTTWKKSASRALTAVRYQQEVEGDPELQKALKELRDNAENTTMTDGEGEGSDEEGLPGGQDGVAGSGVDAWSAQKAVTDDTQSVVTGIGEINTGAEEVQEPSTPASEEPKDGKPATEEKAPVPDNSHNSGGETDDDSDAETVKPGAKPEKSPAPAVSAKPDANKPAAERTDAKPSGGAAGGELRTRYVTVYSAENGDTAVYSLESLLSKPEEKLVSEDTYAKELNERGFHTTLVRQKPAPATTTGGLYLLAITSAATACLLVVLGVIKRRKVDGKSARVRLFSRAGKSKKKDR